MQCPIHSTLGLCLMGSLQHDPRHQCVPQITLKPHLGNSTSGIAIPVTIARDTPGYWRDHTVGVQQ